MTPGRLATADGGALGAWPSRSDWLIAFCVALAVFALEAYVATAIGRTQSLSYDGLGYATDARLKYLRLGNLLHQPLQYVGGYFSGIAGLWSAFLVLTFAITGVGEVQSFFAWFWYVFSLSLLVIWVARSIGGREVAILLGVFTALLPLCSPMLWLAIYYQMGLDWLGEMETNLADNRPDPLAHVFMMWSVVPLLMHGRHAGLQTFLVTAVAVAASVLTKGTTGPLAIGCWGVAMLYVLWLQRDRLSDAIRWTFWAAVVFAACLLPWSIAGGLQAVINYVRDAFAWKPFYEQSATEVGLHHFAFHRYLTAAQLFIPMPVVALMVVVAATGTIVAWRQKAHGTLVLLGGLGIVAAAILLPLYVQKLRNQYLAMPLYLMVWLYAVAAAAFLGRGIRDHRSVRISATAVLTFGFAAQVATAASGAANWPQEDLRRLREGRALIRQIAGDLKRQLGPQDMFAGLVLASGWPLILQFHMTTDEAGYPPSFAISPPAWPNFASEPEVRRRFIAELEQRSKVIVTFKEPPSQLYKQARMSDFFVPYFTAIHEYLNGGKSRYRPVREYVFPEPGRLFFPPAAGTVVIYLRDDVPQVLQ